MAAVMCSANHKAQLLDFIYQVKPHSKLPPKIKVSPLRHLANRCLIRLKAREADAIDAAPTPSPSSSITSLSDPPTAKPSPTPSPESQARTPKRQAASRKTATPLPSRARAA
ncbi:hypothetical protein VP01_275g8 [Puccinia sorghi]|uniref:Uncharacterized protein n=1 Tax=Puccinia sorghi TaxID=27349 RepID=A0A0L6V4Q9_9BASI|nr:hypothetical protein VP01_275g8 [Puccinia sorghi]